jgi:hypothetical protein
MPKGQKLFTALRTQRRNFAGPTQLLANSCILEFEHSKDLISMVEVKLTGISNTCWTLRSFVVNKIPEDVAVGTQYEVCFMIFFFLYFNQCILLAWNTFVLPINHVVFVCLLSTENNVLSFVSNVVA